MDTSKNSANDEIAMLKTRVADLERANARLGTRLNKLRTKQQDNDSYLAGLIAKQYAWLDSLEKRVNSDNHFTTN